MRWFDRPTRRGSIRADSGRDLPVWAVELPAKLRAAGTRVQFDIEKRDGVEQAVRVQPVADPLPSRTPAPRLRRDVAPARDGQQARGPTARVRPVRSRVARKLIEQWVRAGASRRLDDLLALYAPDAILHAGGRDWAGLKELRVGLLDSGGLGPGWDADGVYEGRILRLRRRLARKPCAETRLRLAKGRIVEQWLDVAR